MSYLVTTDNTAILFKSSRTSLEDPSRRIGTGQVLAIVYTPTEPYKFLLVTDNVSIPFDIYDFADLGHKKHVVMVKGAGAKATTNVAVPKVTSTKSLYEIQKWITDKSK